jgi:hypothetical protein
MLDVLTASNNLRSWQIYNDRLGISVRLRFEHGGSSVAAGSTQGNVYMASTEPGSTQQTQATAYSKKSPAHVRRDTQRRISRAKRRRTESDGVENERKNESILIQEEIDHNIMESPTYVCQPPVEDTLTVSPVVPITLDFEMDTLDQFHDYPKSDELLDHSCDAAAAAVLSEPEQDTEIVQCPNCNEKMEEWNHVCEIKSDISESVEVVNEVDDSCEKMAKTIGAILEEMLGVKLPP